MITEQEYDNVRKNLSLFRISKKNELDRLPLDEQRKQLIKSVKYFCLSCGLIDSLEDTQVISNFNDLIEEFLFLSIPKPPLTFEDKRTFVPWLTEERKSSIKWNYFNRYYQYLLTIKKWSSQSVDSIDASSDVILGHCGDPLSSKGFSVKGLVVGDIQAGKTGNYTALINKAIDSGYKLIVVFAGTTNELRHQTQVRLDKEVTGNNTDSEHLDDQEPYGVSIIESMGPEFNKVVTLTSSDLKGDVKRSGFPNFASNSTFFAIIKKRPSSLKTIIKFLKSNPQRNYRPDKKIPTPILIIDDEADQASVNTSGSSEYQDAKTTNKLIRDIIFKECEKVTYIGYTATPYANVFISPHDCPNLNPDDVDDIFPNDFIVNLPTPPDYCGTKQYFGVDGSTIEDDSNIKTDLVCLVSEDDLEEFDGADGTRKDCVSVPDSLRKAIKYFLISTGVKISRGIKENATMLVNVEVKNAFNQQLTENVRSVFNSICRTFKNSPEEREVFRHIWEKEFKPVSEKRLAEAGKVFSDHWDGDGGIEQGVFESIKMANSETVKWISGDKDSNKLEYNDKSPGVYVVVGGQKLSRGLTLEGLSISYYGRHAQSIDTLMQMGRWFGYRNGWLDLCRVFTTKNILKDYVEAAIVTEDFKTRLAELNANPNSTPRDYGLCVRAGKKLLPTARNKMTGAKSEKISYSGSLSQTIEFFIEQKDHNTNVLESFIHEFNNPQHFSTRADFKRPILKKVPVDAVLKLFSKLSFPSDRINSWIDYIKECNKTNELVDWTIVLSSLKTPSENKVCIDGFTIFKGSRTQRFGEGVRQDIVKIRALSQPDDYFGFFPDGVTPQKFDCTNDPAVVRYFTPEHGILVIYFVDLCSRNVDGTTGSIIDRCESTPGLAIWFPKAKFWHGYTMYMNPVYAEARYQDSDAASIVAHEEDGNS